MLTQRAWQLTPSPGILPRPAPWPAAGRRGPGSPRGLGSHRGTVRGSPLGRPSSGRGGGGGGGGSCRACRTAPPGRRQVRWSCRRCQGVMSELGAWSTTCVDHTLGPQLSGVCGKVGKVWWGWVGPPHASHIGFRFPWCPCKPHDGEGNRLTQITRRWATLPNDCCCMKRGMHIWHAFWLTFATGEKKKTCHWMMGLKENARTLLNPRASEP